MNELRFDTKLNTEPVALTIEGEEKNFELRELLGRERDSFLTELGTQTHYIDGKPVGLKDYRGMHARLLTRCLFDDANKPVTKEFIQGLPARITSALFSAAQELSGLTKVDEAEALAKND